MKRIHSIALITTSIAIPIMGILIAVGVIGWRAAVRSANEAAAIKSLTTISEQQQLYYNSHQRSSFGTFDEMLKGNLLDTRFAGTAPVVDGFVYTMTVTPKSPTQEAAFAVSADPTLSEGFGATGKNHFYLNSHNDAVHVNSRQPATASDPVIEQN